MARPRKPPRHRRCLNLLTGRFGWLVFAMELGRDGCPGEVLENFASAAATLHREVTGKPHEGVERFTVKYGIPARHI